MHAIQGTKVFSDLSFPKRWVCKIHECALYSKLSVNALSIVYFVLCVYFIVGLVAILFTEVMKGYNINANKKMNNKFK
jgi:hypothetical protein